MNQPAPIQHRSEPFWQAETPSLDLPSLDGDIEADVVVVGGGIVGLTAALLLKRAGRRVVVLEARAVGGQATGRSTAKVTAQHSLIYSEIQRRHGADAAHAYAAANGAAVSWIKALVREASLDCDLEECAAYAYAATPDRQAAVREEAELAARLGLPSSYVDTLDLPFATHGAVRFDAQAQFHPGKYLAGLAGLVNGGGCQVFERSRVTEIDSGPKQRVATGSGSVAARDVIVATQLPTLSGGMYFAKALPFSHPMIAAPLDPARAPDGMFISVGQPSLSLRTARLDGQLFLVAVGRTFKTGHPGEATEAIGALEELLHSQYELRQPTYRWVNEDYAPVDGLPMVGSATSGEAHIHVATGFAAWGISNGTAAAMILADRVRERENAWSAVFDSTRSKLIKGGATMAGGNVEVAQHLAEGYLRPHPKSAADLAAGDGAVLEIDGERMAVHREPDGRLHAVSAVCTHMKCIVGWNPIDRSWDCPCHGSRFAVDGSVMTGPAVRPLAAKSIPPG